MKTTLLLVAAAVLLSACADDEDSVVASNTMIMDSENCRAAIEEKMAHARSASELGNADSRARFSRGYRGCMADKGYALGN
jgi:uncharacterized protein YcfL